jgi:UDP-N-acetylmuramate dehydrogenase
MPNLAHITRQLKEKSVGTVLTEELLSTHSTWKIGGPADIFVLPAQPQGLSDTLQMAREYALPVVIIGGGSNLLFDDEGVRGIVIKIDVGLSHIEIDDNRIRVGAGVWVPCLARAAGKAGLTGLEHIIGIPGTFGGLLFMNGGSQRKSISECVQKVRVIDRRGRQQEFSKQECHFTYRKSVFQQTDFIILGADIECQPGDSGLIRQEMLAILRSRSEKFPRKLPNCGSVFVSDPAMYDSFGPPGKIIEDCNFKGAAVGDAEVSRHHANFIVNTGRATSAQVMELIGRIRWKVYERTNCWLRCEVRYVPPGGEVKQLHTFL